MLRVLSPRRLPGLATTSLLCELDAFQPEVLSEIREELMQIVKAADTGEPVSPIPAIPLPLPKHRELSRRGDQLRAFDDEETPF